MTPVTRSFPSTRDLRADVFAAVGDDQRTAVLVLHGGGWRMGGPEHLHPRCRALRERGFTVIALEYRLLGEAPFPAALDDVRAAVRWTREHAGDLGVEPDRIALQGHSAGAHLALLAAYTAGPGTDDAVAAVVACYPPVGFHAAAAPAEGEPPRRPAARDDGLSPAWVLLAERGEDEDLVRAASPIAHVSASCPPTMLVHGTADPVVPHGSSLVLHKALLDAGAPADLHLYHGVSHEFDAAPSMTEVVQDEAARFYRRTVSQAPAVADELAEFDFFRRR